MKLHLEASPSELTTESVESLSERIKGAARLVAKAALTEGLSKARERTDHPRRSKLEKARPTKHRGGEIDLVVELASKMTDLYERRLDALLSDVEALETQVKD